MIKVRYQNKSLWLCSYLLFLPEFMAKDSDHTLWAAMVYFRVSFLFPTIFILKATLEAFILGHGFL